MELLVQGETNFRPTNLNDIIKSRRRDTEGEKGRDKKEPDRTEYPFIQDTVR